MYCLLKSQLDGKPFLVTSVDNESDVEHIEGYVRDIEMMYSLKQWYEGMIRQLEQEEK